MKSLNKADTSVFHYYMCSLFQRHPLFHFSAAGIKFPVAAIKMSPRTSLYEHSAVLIFTFIGIIEPILVSRENRVPLKPMLGVGEEGSPANYIAVI